MPIVLYKKRNKGVVGVQDAEGKTWHTKGPHEDRDAMKAKSPAPMAKGGDSGTKKTP